MRTSAPSLLPLFRSEMQLRLLALLLLQPERAWTLHELTDDLDAPQSSVHQAAPVGPRVQVSYSAMTQRGRTGSPPPRAIRCTSRSPRY